MNSLCPWTVYVLPNSFTLTLAIEFIITSLTTEFIDCLYT